MDRKADLNMNIFKDAVMESSMLRYLKVSIRGAVPLGRVEGAPLLVEGISGFIILFTE